MGAPRRLHCLLCFALLGTFSLATAQTPSGTDPSARKGMAGMQGMEGMGGMGMGPGPAYGQCGRAADPALCEEHRRLAAEARQKAVEACKDVPEADRRRCIGDLRMAGQDCSQAGQPERCAAIRVAYDSCKGQPGPAMRACMHELLPPADCSKATNPAHCAALKKARATCGDKPAGPDRRQCMSEQPGLNNPRQ